MTLRIVSAFDTAWLFDTFEVQTAAFGATLRGFAREEGSLLIEDITTRLETAKEVSWVEEEVKAA